MEEQINKWGVELIIGCHQSTSKGFCKTVEEAIAIGANTFQFFPRNPRGSKARELDLEDANRFREFVDSIDFGPVVAHGAYTMNLCSDKKEIRQLAKNLIRDDLNRLKIYGIKKYVIHPGSHVNQGVEYGINQISQAFNEIMKGDDRVEIALELMAGKGSEIGRSVEEISSIIEKIEYPHMGICLDTCHIYSSGYDIKNEFSNQINNILNHFGDDKVFVLHINDSMTEYNSNKDRHEKIGKGNLGFGVFQNIANHPVLMNKPMILETPNDMNGYRDEIKLLKSMGRRNTDEKTTK